MCSPIIAAQQPQQIRPVAFAWQLAHITRGFVPNDSNTNTPPEASRTSADKPALHEAQTKWRG
jgi:hypothetical protein